MNPTLELSDNDRLHSLKGTHPEARPQFERLLELARELGMSPYVSSATRTCEEQAGLSQSAVTGCGSWHTFGRAVDLELHDVWGAFDNPETYQLLGELWEEMGGIWGGRFVMSYPDGLPGYPRLTEGDPVHFQWSQSGRVPASLCPPTAQASIEQCQSHVDAYLRAAFARAAGGELEEPHGRGGYWGIPLAVFTLGVSATAGLAVRRYRRAAA